MGDQVVTREINKICSEQRKCLKRGYRKYMRVMGKGTSVLPLNTIEFASFASKYHQSKSGLNMTSPLDIGGSDLQEHSRSLDTKSFEASILDETNIIELSLITDPVKDESDVLDQTSSGFDEHFEETKSSAKSERFEDGCFEENNHIEASGDTVSAVEIDSEPSGHKETLDYESDEDHVEDDK